MSLFDKPPVCPAQAGGMRNYELRGRFGFPAEILSQYDGVRQILHRTAETAAFIAKAKISFFFRETVTLLEDPFRSLYDFAGLELTLHLLRFFKQSRVLFREQRLRNGTAHLLADESQQRNFVRGVLVRFAMMHVDDAYNIAAAHQRDREEGFVSIFHQRGKALEPAIGPGILCQRDHRLVFRHPAGDTFADLHAQITESGRVRHLRSAQNHFVGRRFQKINEARVAPSDLCGQPNDFAEHFIERQLGANNAADAMKKSELRARRLHNMNGSHTPAYDAVR